MIGFWALLIVPVVAALRYADRNQTHLLFEYRFTQNECNSGVFAPYNDVHGLSFGNLLKKDSLRCLDRNGYKSEFMKVLRSFESEGTFQNLKNRIMETRELSIEFWMQNYPGNYVISMPFAIDPEDAEEQEHTVFTVLLLGDKGHLFVKEKEETIQSHEFIDFRSASKYVHVVITAEFRSDCTLYKGYVNGTQYGSDQRNPVQFASWNASAKFYGSRLRSLRFAPPCWGGEVYAVAFYDHALPLSQILHNTACSVPPSLPSIRITSIHIPMNRMSPLSIPLYDFNVDSHSNLFDGYSSEMRLMSLPQKGTLYSSAMSPIVSLPPTGLVILNSTFFFLPNPGEFGSDVYATLVFSLQNSYGTLSPKSVSIIVDWVNSDPIVANHNYTLSTTEIKHVVIDVVDHDGDKNYTRFVQISPNCRLLTPLHNDLLYDFAFDVEYVGGAGGSEDDCIIEYLVGDSHGGKSSPANLRFHVTNTLSLAQTAFEVKEGMTSEIDLHLDDVFVDLVTLPSHGLLSGNSSLLVYSAEAFYFTSPKVDADGNPIGHEDEGFACTVVHKGLSSPLFHLTLVILNVNSPPRLAAVSSLPFFVYASTPVSISVFDDDFNTEVCTLTLTTTTGFFSIALAPHNHTLPGLEWLEGNYGEGMEDNKLVARGSLRAINASLHTLAYRAVYRLNDTVVVKVVDGEFVAETRVAMLYTMEEKKSVGWPFVVVMAVIGVGVVVCVRLLCCCCCSCHKKRELVKKENVVKKEIEVKKEVEMVEKRTVPPPLPPALTTKKKTPPPLPSSLPPKNETRQAHSAVATPENVEPHSKASVRPPTVGM